MDVRTAAGLRRPAAAALLAGALCGGGALAGGAAPAGGGGAAAGTAAAGVAAPAAIYRLSIAGELGLAAGARREVVPLSGPVEIVEWPAAGGEQELVKMALDGRSEILGGAITLAAGGAGAEARRSLGHLGEASGFKLFLEVQTPSGTLRAERPVEVRGTSAARQLIDEADLGGQRGKVPVYAVALVERGAAESPLLDRAGQPVGLLTSLTLKAERVAGRRPCCPVKKGNP